MYTYMYMYIYIYGSAIHYIPPEAGALAKYSISVVKTFPKTSQAAFARRLLLFAKKSAAPCHAAHECHEHVAQHEHVVEH